MMVSFQEMAFKNTNNNTVKIVIAKHCSVDRYLDGCNSANVH